MFKKSALALLVALATLTACKKEAAQTPAPQAAPAGKLGGELNLAIWSNYLTPEIIGEFEKRTGTKVNVSNYSSNEELLAKLQAGASGYDVVVPSDYMVLAMVQLGLIRELDRTKLPNFKNLDAKFLGKSYDSANKHSVPYDWGTTGIAINRTKYTGPVKGWKDVFNTPALAGKFSLLDDVRETLGAALKSLGFSMNTKDPAQLKQAKELLFGIRKKIKAFTSEPMTPLVNGEIAVAHAYMSDALQARRKTGGKIEYVIPEEGGTLWVDNLVIPTGSKNVEQAHAFINYLLEAQTNLETVKAVLVAPTNSGTFALLPPDLQKDVALFPPANVLSRLEMVEDLGEDLTAWDRVWTEVKARR